MGGRQIKLEHYHNVGGSSATAQSRLAGMIECALLAPIRDTLRMWQEILFAGGADYVAVYDGAMCAWDDCEN